VDQDGVELIPTNGRTNITPRAGHIDLPVEPVNADVAWNALIRIEAKLDALLNDVRRIEDKSDTTAARVNWVVDTVTQEVNNIRAALPGVMKMTKMIGMG
jgi:hypothetical protein